jgi:hypothetical protein
MTALPFLFAVAVPLLMFFTLTFDVWRQKDRAWWAAAARNVGLFVAALVAIAVLEVAMYFWAVPVLFFFFRHATALLWTAIVGTILGIWAHCAYENYKTEVALKRKHAGHADAWLLFHLICTTLFITAFIHAHAQAMAHVALVWGFTAVVGLVQYL